MLTLSKFQKICVYTFSFSLNFETVNLFNLNIDYLASKMTILLLFSITLINFPTVKSVFKYFSFLMPLVIFFIYLTIISYLNQPGSQESYFYFPLFLDILIMFLLLSIVKRYRFALYNGLIAFSIGTFLLSLLFFFNIGVEMTKDGRMSIFDINQNMLGLNACFAIFVLLFYLLSKENLNVISKYIIGGMIFMLILMLIKTGSRGAFLSFIAGILIFLFSNKDISNRKKYLLIFFFILFFISLWLFFLKDSVLFQRLVTSVNDGDLSNRDLIWINLFDIISNNYTFGIGVTGYEKIVGKESPHNVFIEVLCYSGVIGLILFIKFLYKIGRECFIMVKNNILPFVLFVNSLGLILTGQIFAQKIIWLIFSYQISLIYLQKFEEKYNNQIV